MEEFYIGLDKLRIFYELWDFYRCALELELSSGENYNNILVFITKMSNRILLIPYRTK